MTVATATAGPVGPFSPPGGPRLARQHAVPLSVSYFDPEEDAAREAHIAHCGEQMQACYAAGNREAAENWMQAQAEAIRGRSAAQVRLMESCYFAAQGSADRAAMEAQR